MPRSHSSPSLLPSPLSVPLQTLSTLSPLHLANHLLLHQCCLIESPLDCKEIQPVHSEGNQPLDFFGRNDAKAETPVLWPHHVKSWLIGKDSDAWRDWGQEEKGTTEDEMAGWHHWLDGHESEWTLGVGDGQGGLACCDSWGRKESDMTERLNWTELESFTLANVFISHTISWPIVLHFFIPSSIYMVQAAFLACHSRNRAFAPSMLNYSVLFHLSDCWIVNWDTSSFNTNL